jgi:hypothetical protein
MIQELECRAHAWVATIILRVKIESLNGTEIATLTRPGESGPIYDIKTSPPEKVIVAFREVEKRCGSQAQIRWTRYSIYYVLLWSVLAVVFMMAVGLYLYRDRVEFERVGGERRIKWFAAILYDLI